MNTIIRDGEDGPFRNTQAAPSSVKRAFALRLNRARLAKGWSQSDLGRAAGMDRNRISSYARGLSLPTDLFLKKLADALGVKSSDLLPEATASDTPAPYQFTAIDDEHDRIVCDIVVSKSVSAQIIPLIVANATAHRD